MVETTFPTAGLLPRGTSYYRDGERLTSHEIMIEAQLDQIKQLLERIATALEANKR